MPVKQDEVLALLERDYRLGQYKRSHPISLSTKYKVDVDIPQRDEQGNSTTRQGRGYRFLGAPTAEQLHHIWATSETAHEAARHIVDIAVHGKRDSGTTQDKIAVEVERRLAELGLTPEVLGAFKAQRDKLQAQHATQPKPHDQPAPQAATEPAVAVVPAAHGAPEADTHPEGESDAPEDPQPQVPEIQIEKRKRGRPRKHPLPAAVKPVRPANPVIADAIAKLEGGAP